MWSLLLGLAYLSHLPEEGRSCAATSGTTVTTTAATVTTTTTALACAGCTLNNPAIEHLKVQQGAVDITTDTVSIDPNTGCALRTITCDGNGAGSTVFISWNNEAAGTTQGAVGANFVSGTLTCSPDGTSWLLVVNGVPITQAECDST